MFVFCIRFWPRFRFCLNCNRNKQCSHEQFISTEIRFNLEVIPSRLLEINETGKKLIPGSLNGMISRQRNRELQKSSKRAYNIDEKEM